MLRRTQRESRHMAKRQHQNPRQKEHM
jgi:hypothetical protein